MDTSFPPTTGHPGRTGRWDRTVGVPPVRGPLSPDRSEVDPSGDDVGFRQRTYPSGLSLAEHEGARIGRF